MEELNKNRKQFDKITAFKFLLTLFINYSSIIYMLVLV